MDSKAFSSAALVVLGHGTTQNDGSAVPVFQHAQTLRQRGIFAEVREAFWKQEPQIRQVLDSLTASQIFIVPLFISEGYFSEEVIPPALGFTLTADPQSRITHHASRTIHYCLPVGTHESMTKVILARAHEVVARYPFPHAPKPKNITLFIAGHGTGRNAKSRESIERQVALIREQQLYAAVHAIYMEEDPRIGDCFTLAQTRYAVVVPFFISDGLHSQEDIPVLLGEPERLVKERLAAGTSTWRNPTERRDKLVWYSPSVGTEPLMADVILQRVHEAIALERPAV